MLKFTPLPICHVQITLALHQIHLRVIIVSAKKNPMVPKSPCQRHSGGSFACRTFAKPLAAEPHGNSVIRRWYSHPEFRDIENESQCHFSVTLNYMGKSVSGHANDVPQCQTHGIIVTIRSKDGENCDMTGNCRGTHRR